MINFKQKYLVQGCPAVSYILESMFNYNQQFVSFVCYNSCGSLLFNDRKWLFPNN